MSTHDLTQPLADCLARIEAGESPAAALDRYRDLRPRLAPLVTAALAVQAVPLTPAPPAFRAALGAELAERATARTAPSTVAPAPGRPWAVLLALAVAVLGLTAVVLWGERAWPRTATVHAPVQPASAGSGITGQTAGMGPRPVLRRQPPAAAPTATPRSPGADRAPAGMAVVIEAATTPATRGPTFSSPTAIGASATSSPTDTQLPPEPPDEDRRPTATLASSPTTFTSTPPATASPTPAGSVVIAGFVKQGDAALAGMVVELFAASVVADCAPEPAVSPDATAQTDENGWFELSGLAAGRYRLSARGGARCLPWRWHTGENSPGAAGPCDEGVVELDLAEGVTARSINVLFETELMSSCP